jgi:hypothetical protein
MKTAVVVAALVAAAIAAPTEAASKKHKKVAHRAPTAAAQPAPGSYDVYDRGELVGRDPDPSIRAYMKKDPRPWEGND